MAVTATPRATSNTSELTATQRSALNKAAWRLLPLLAMAAIMLAATVLSAALKLIVKQE